MPSNPSTVAETEGRPAPDATSVRALWRSMRLIRRAEESIAELAELGRARCPCHLYIGQEAVAAGVCAALAEPDSVWGGHRSHGHYLARGGSLEGLFAEVLGKATGCSGGRGGSMHLLAREVGIFGTVPIVAGTVPLAAGAAMAYKLRGEPRVACAFFGDGALEEGHVHETMNLAALYRLPLLLVCENNQYSSHLHWSERRVRDNLHEAGEFHGVPGIRVDGNDVEAVLEAASVAATRARVGCGPTLMECRTFRFRGHVGPSSDRDVGVKRRDELAGWLEQDPLLRCEGRLRALGIQDLAPDAASVEHAVRVAMEAAEAAPFPKAVRVREHVWNSRPDEAYRGVRCAL
jgi:TPP-dependent pyruvate/acetoin dehydrogenase alpha subunit